MVERDGLEIRCARQGTVGSNPTLSAKFDSHGHAGARSPYSGLVKFAHRLKKSVNFFLIWV